MRSDWLRTSLSLSVFEVEVIANLAMRWLTIPYRPYSKTLLLSSHPCSIEALAWKACKVLTESNVSVEEFLQRDHA